MLVLTRKTNEKIRLGDEIVVTVLKVKGNAVRIGIEAPKDVRVVRAELPPKEVHLTVEESLTETVVGKSTNGAPAAPVKTLKDYMVASHAV